MVKEAAVIQRMSQLLLEFSRSGVIILDVAGNAEHLKAGDFIVKEFNKYIRKCQVPKICQNLEESIQYIALNAVAPEDGRLARDRRAKGIKYPSYCVNEVNKGIYIFVSLCKMGAIRLDLDCIEDRQLLQMLKEEILLYKRVFPWEDVLMASVRIMDMAVAVGCLQRMATGRSEFLRAVGSII